MVNRVAMILLLALGSAAFAADVFRWVDENGKVHYGDSVPERFKQYATKLQSEDPEAVRVRREEAANRVAREKAAAEAMSNARENDSSAARPDGRPGPQSNEAAGCADQIRKYQESLACFDTYRNANGSTKAEAFQKCVQVKQPTRCLTSPAPSDRPVMPESAERTYDIPTQPR